MYTFQLILNLHSIISIFKPGKALKSPSPDILYNLFIIKQNVKTSLQKQRYTFIIYFSLFRVYITCILLLNVLRISFLLKISLKEHWTELIEKQDGLLKWCMLLKSLDEVSGSTVYDQCFRVINKHLSEEADVKSENYLDICRCNIIMYFHSASFDLETLDKLIMKAAQKYHQNNPSNSNQLVLFYMTFIFPSFTSVFRPSMIMWIDHAYSLVDDFPEHKATLSEMILQMVQKSSCSLILSTLLMLEVHIVENKALVTQLKADEYYNLMDNTNYIPLAMYIIQRFSRTLQKKIDFIIQQKASSDDTLFSMKKFEPLLMGAKEILYNLTKALKVYNY